MATEGNGGLSEEVRGGQLMDPALERVDASLMEDSTQNSFPYLKLKIHGLVGEAFEHFVKSGPESVAAFLKEDSTQNTIALLDSRIRPLVGEAFEHFVKSGPESVAAFLKEDSTQNTIPWLDSKIVTLVGEAFEHFVKSGPESVAAFLKEDSTQNTIKWLDSNIRTLVGEAFEHFLKSGPESSVNRREQIQEPDIKILQLRFDTSMPDHFFVGKKVKGRDGFLRVRLIDTTTGYVVASGPLSSLTLDVVVLAGDFNNKYDDDWTWELFNSKVQLSRQGKGPLLEGDLQVLLKDGVGWLAEFKFTDISTCRPSGKFRLGVKVEPGFFEGIRVREAKTDAFKVIHRKRISEEKHVPRGLGDDVCLLMGIRMNGAFHRNLKNAGIFKVVDFLWKLGLDPEGFKKIVAKTMSEKNWEILRDHAKKSVPSGKYHVYCADDTERSGVVFKNMSELCGLIEDGKYYSAETLSDNKKLLVDTLKRKASDNWKHIVEYDDRMLDMNQSVAPSEQVFVNPGPAVGDDFCNQTISGGCHGFLGSKDVRMECGSSGSVLSENYEFGSGTYFSSIIDMASVPSGKSLVCIAKESASKKVAGDKGKAIEEYVGPLQSEMTPSKRAHSSQTHVVTGAPESCPPGIDLASSLYVGSPVNPGLAVGAALPCLPPSVPSGEAFKSSILPDSEAGYGDSFEQGQQLRGSNSPNGGGNGDMGVGNTSSHGGNINLGTIQNWNNTGNRNTKQIQGVIGGTIHMGNNTGNRNTKQIQGVGNTGSHGGNINLGTIQNCNNTGNRNTKQIQGVIGGTINMGNNTGNRNTKQIQGVGNTSSLQGNINTGVGKADGGGGKDFLSSAFGDLSM